jgi:ketosteroid isomerase-like protein
MKRKHLMSSPTDTVKNFYSRLAAGDAQGAMGLMTDDIEWITMMDFNLDGRGPQQVADNVLTPLMNEWSSFAPTPSEFIVQGNTVISLGKFTCIHKNTGKRAEALYAHVWRIKDDKIARFQQYIDTLAIAEARRSG